MHVFALTYAATNMSIAMMQTAWGLWMHAWSPAPTQRRKK